MISFQNYWRLFFLLNGIATIFGGIGHGTRYYYDIVGPNFFRVAWILGALAIAYMQLSAIGLLERENLKKWLTYFVYVEFIVFVIVLLANHSFQWVNINTALGTLGFLFTIHLYCLLKQKYDPSKWIMAGILILPSVLVAKSFEWKLGIFNHHDIAHFVVIASMYAFFVAAKKMFRNHPFVTTT